MRLMAIITNDVGLTSFYQVVFNMLVVFLQLESVTGNDVVSTTENLEHLEILETEDEKTRAIKGILLAVLTVPMIILFCCCLICCCCRNDSSFRPRVETEGAMKRRRLAIIGE